MRAWAGGRLEGGDGRLEGDDDGRLEGDDDGRLEGDDDGLPEAMGEVCLAVEVLEADREGEGEELVLVFSSSSSKPSKLRRRAIISGDRSTTGTQTPRFMNVGVPRKCKAGDPDLAGEDLVGDPNLAGEDLAGDPNLAGVLGGKDFCVNLTECLVGDLVADATADVPSAAQTPRFRNNGVEDVDL